MHQEASGNCNIGEMGKRKQTESKTEGGGVSAIDKRKDGRAKKRLATYCGKVPQGKESPEAFGSAEEAKNKKP